MPSIIPEIHKSPDKLKDFFNSNAYFKYMYENSLFFNCFGDDERRRV